MRRETQNILLVLLGGALLKISFTGTYLRYVKPAHQWLLILAGVVMLVLAAVSIARDLTGRTATEPLPDTDTASADGTHAHDVDADTPHAETSRAAGVRLGGMDAGTARVRGADVDTAQAGLARADGVDVDTAQTDAARADVAQTDVARADVARAGGADVGTAHAGTARVGGVGVDTAQADTARGGGAHANVASASHTDVVHADVTGADVPQAAGLSEGARADVAGMDVAQVGGASGDRSGSARADAGPAEEVRAEVEDEVVARADVVCADVTRADVVHVVIRDAEVVGADGDHVGASSGATAGGAGAGVRADVGSGDAHADHDDGAHDAHGHDDHVHSTRSAWLLALPVFAVFLVAPPALGADSVQRAADTAPRVAAASEDDGSSLYPPLPEDDVLALQLTEFVERAAWDSADSLDDRRIRLTGFVVHEGDGGYLARMAIGCCAADAYPVKVQLTGADLAGHPDDSWIEVVVELVPDTATKANEYVPSATVHALRPVPEPKDPYEH